MKKLIFCMVGTSVFHPDKYKTGVISREFLNLCNAIGNDEIVDTRRILNDCKEKNFNSASEQFVTRIRSGETRTKPFPAEIASLMKMMILKDTGGTAKYGLLADGDKVVLLFSDSPEGGLAALLIGAIIAKAYFSETVDIGKIEEICTPKPGDSGTAINVTACTYVLTCHVDLVRIPGLQVLDNATVNSGLKNLIEIIRHCSVDKYPGYTRLFNFTAGFKGITPFAFMTSLKEGFTAFFLHENGPEVIYFSPNTSVIFNWYDYIYPVVDTAIASDKSGNVIAKKAAPAISPVVTP